MRSLGFTLILALLALFMGSVASWQWAGRNFDDLLGTPPVKVGERLYDWFSPADVKRIRVSANGTVAFFELGEQGWQALSPWKDRMDPRAAVSIINFTLGMRVEDFAKTREIEPVKAGLGDNRIDIRLDDKDHRQLCRYKLASILPLECASKTLLKLAKSSRSKRV